MIMHSSSSPRHDRHHPQSNYIEQGFMAKLDRHCTAWLTAHGLMTTGGFAPGAHNTKNVRIKRRVDQLEKEDESL